LSDREGWLAEQAGRLGVVLSPQARVDLVRYAARLAAWGDLLGLTSLRQEESILQELVLDSLAAAPFLPPGASLVDVGSGGGLPGIPLALARPELEACLVEAQERKVRFLEETVAELGLAGRVRVAWGRAETLARDPAYRERFGAAVGKALAPLPVLLELTLPFLQVGGLLVAHKGPALDRELEQAGRALEILGGRVEQVRPYELGGRACRLCLVRKVAPTPSLYPRRPGVPARKPL
jgi:16S rRNA (guanine527-N7)-methyltransferase